jgi:hypothetical protein
MKETLGEHSKTIWIFGRPKQTWIPLMNPVYLTINNLWNDRATDTEEKN